jgi:hypothetical protein
MEAEMQMADLEGMLRAVPVTGKGMPLGAAT